MLKRNAKFTVFILLIIGIAVIHTGCGTREEPADAEAGPMPAQEQQEQQQQAAEEEEQPASEGDAGQTAQILLDIDKAEAGTHLGDVTELVPVDLPLPDNHEVYVGNATGYTKMENTLQLVFTYTTNEDEAAIIDMYETYIKGKGSFTITKAADPLIKMTAIANNPYQMFDVTLQPREQGGFDVSISIACSKY